MNRVIVITGHPVGLGRSPRFWLSPALTSVIVGAKRIDQLNGNLIRLVCRRREASS